MDKETLYSIGEFSMITKLSVKTLRFYHEKGLLNPDYIDPQNGYRYYGKLSVDRAVVIAQLRQFDLPLSELQLLLENSQQIGSVSEILRQHQNDLTLRMKQYKKIIKQIEEVLSDMNSEKNCEFEIEEKVIPDMLFSGYKMKGKYEEIGTAFKVVAKAAGRFIRGKAMALYYDCDYKENDASFEGGFPVSKKIDKPNISCRTLKGGKAVTLVHKGPYQSLSRSYEKVLGYMKEKGYQAQLPSREIYMKGPGIIFMGNPNNYLTEIVFLIQ